MFNRKRIVASLMTVLLVPLLAACSSGQSTASGPVEVRVTLSEFAFESTLTTFNVGVPYHFVVTNNGAVAHEIMLMQPMEMPAGMTMEAMDQMALAHIEAADLPVGGTSTLDYTFTEPAAASALEFACHIAGHYDAGMKLPITVISKYPVE